MIDRDRLHDILSAIGKELRKPARLTLIGSAASIISGQGGRQTPDIDVWRPASDFDAEDFRNACEKAGILYDPKGQIGDEDEYIQIVRPGIVSLPAVSGRRKSTAMAASSWKGPRRADRRVQAVARQRNGPGGRCVVGRERRPVVAGGRAGDRGTAPEDGTARPRTKTGLPEAQPSRRGLIP